MDADLKTRAEELLVKLDVEGKRKQVRELEALSSHPDFWKEPKVASGKMKLMAALQKEIIEGEEFALLLELGDEESLLKEISRLEYAMFLGGTFDRGDAILAIHSGQGGTEAMDWTSMLHRMYCRYVERKGWSMEEMDYTPGEEAGIKSVTMEIRGAYAYGFLKAEVGVHRLVRQSPFNADNLRQTSFAMVEVLPVVEDDIGIEIKDEELEWEFYRAGGKGGQNVNKVSTAVRLKHKPSGIIVASQAQRYQGQNREFALKMLKAKLWDLEEQKRLAEVTKMRGTYKTPGWGNQIRSYVLHPYHMVKDLRTQYETSATEHVLDGQLDEFILAYLKKFS